MNWLEVRFRRKFVPHGDDYLFQQVDREVIFDAEDVELLAADWRRYWLNPWLWGAMLLSLGWAVASIRLNLLDGYLIFPFLIACLILLCGLVSLWVAQRGPAETAFTRPSVGPGHKWPSYWRDIFGIALALFWLGIVKPDGLLGYWGYVFWGSALVFYAVRLLLTLWKRYATAT